MPTLASWFHAHADPVSRGEGKSAVGLAAYMTGETLKDERTGLWCKRNHPGEVLDWGTVAPKNAPAYLTDDDQLGKAWNQVEKSEKRKDSHVANHWNIASSREFSEDDHIAVAQAMARELTDRYGVMVTWAVHKPTDHGDDRNWHIHLGYNMRRITNDGFGAKASELTHIETRKAELGWQRKMIADVLNDRLELIGSLERVSHETYAKQGVDKEPTKHRGNEANQLELQGIPTRVGDENREIEARNRQRLEERTAAVAEIHSEVLAMAEPNRYEDLKRDAAEAEGIKKQADDLVAQAKEMGAVKERLAAFEENTKKQAERAKEQQAELRKADEKRIAEGDVRSAQNRYAEALAGTYDPRRPYASLANAAMAEYGMLAREDQAMRKQAANETDPAKREAIDQRRQIMILDYMAFTSERLARQSEHVTGKTDSPEAIRQRERAAEFRHKATEKRGEMTAEREAQRKVERQQMAEKLGNLAQNVARGSVIDGSGLQYAGAEPRNMTAAQRKEWDKKIDLASRPASGESPDHAPAKVVARQAEETKQREGLRTGETAEGKPSTQEGREADRSEKSEIAKAWAEKAANELRGGFKEMEALRTRLQGDEIKRTAFAEKARSEEDERRRADAKRTLDGEPTSAESRWAQAVGNNYNITNPYGSLANAAMAEYGMFKRQQEELRKDAAAEKDPEKRLEIEQRRLIETNEYMAITHQRLAGISDAIAERKSEQGELDRQKAAAYREEANRIREERGDRAAEREKQERNAVAEKTGELAKDVGYGLPVNRGLEFTGNPGRHQTAAQREEAEQRVRQEEEKSKREGLPTDRPTEGAGDNAVVRRQGEADRKEKTENRDGSFEAGRHYTGQQPTRPTGRGRGGR